MKFAICNEMFVNEPIDQVIECVARLGFDGIELAPFSLCEDPSNLPESAQRRIAACAADNGIAISGLHWLLARPKGLHITTADAAVRRRTQDFFRKLIEIGVNTGGTILTLGSPAQRSFADGDDHAAAAKRTAGFFRDLTPEIEASGITVALEPLEPAATNFMTRTEDACALAEAIGSPAIGITLDTHFLRWECRTFGGTVLERMRRAGSRLAHLHIQDDNDLAPGTGHADFSGFAEAVRTIGWENFISFEAFDVNETGRGETLAADCIRFFKSTFS